MDIPDLPAIVVLDGHTLNPGDLDWSPLEAAGKLTVYPRTDEEAILERASNAEIVFTNKTPLSRATIEALDCLRFIGVLATGYNVVDVPAATDKGVPVANVPAYGTSSVAQFTFALILELCHRVAMHTHTVSQGEWTLSPDFTYWKTPQVELNGLTLGIYGYGNIGRQVATIGRAFGMNTVVHTRSPKPEPGVEFVGLDELFRRSDIVTLHAPLTSENREIVDLRLLSLMRPTAFLVNTARGPLIKEADLLDALQNRKLAGAGLDVLSVEPPTQGNPLIDAPNCIITPHMAWASRAARQRLLDIAVSNLRSFLDGRPTNLVNEV